MKYMPVLLLFALGACAEHHTLTECKGPYLAMVPPPPAPVQGPPAPPPVVKAKPQTVVAN